MFTSKNLIEEIYKNHNDLDLFKFYVPNISLNQNCQSPLRNDDNEPSFSLYVNRNNNLNFCDHGLKMTGNVFELIKLLYDINYKQSVEKIYCDLNNIPYSLKVLNLKNKPKKAEIDYYLKKPNINDKNFWLQYLNNLQTLNLFKIYCLMYYGFKNYKFYSKDSYIFKVGTRVKIYQPFKEPKYFGNTNSNSIQGWHMLNFDKKDLLLVSSMKEVIVLFELGYQAIAPNSESTIISPKIINYLKFYWNIQILYDWDKAGLINAKKHSVMYNIPINNKQFDNMKPKDISDFRKIYGFGQLKNYFI